MILKGIGEFSFPDYFNISKQLSDDLNAMVKLKLPLLIKLVLLTGILLVVSSLYIAKQNSELFSMVSFEREEEHNLNLAKSLSQGLKASLNGLIDRTKAFSLEAVKISKERDVNGLKILTEKLKQSNHVHLLNIFSRESGDFKSIQKISNPVLNAQQKEDLFAINWDESKDLLLQSLNGEIVLKKYLENKKDPYVIISIPIIKSGDTFSHFAIALIHSTYFGKFLNSYKKNEIFITDFTGTALAASQEQFLEEGYINAKPTIDGSITKSNIEIMTKRYQDKKGHEYILSMSKAAFGVYIFSNLSSQIINQPAVFITRQGQFTLGLVISVAFFFIFIFSSSITSPIELLENLFKEVSTGNFDVTASDKIKSRDEVGSLAKSFDQMTSGLKEREKMRNLFDKLHGSAITDELLKTTMKPQGTSRDVVVFFSDIRGFTDYSENHTAEEVVDMLNSYFEVMVGIINSHDGVVDKFIGDAIVAVWGVPEKSDRDCHKAITACMEMRKALVGFNQNRIDKGEAPIKMGSGLNYGRVISGTIGSTERMEYTVIGDTVNTAARIEASTKGFGTDLLISQAIVDKIKDEFIIDIAGHVQAKGKSEPLALYNVLGTIDADGIQHIVKTPYSSYDAEGESGGKTKKVEAPIDFKNKLPALPNE